MNLSLQAQYDTLSVEALAGESSLQKALTRLPAFFKAVGTKLTEAVAQPIQALFVPKDIAWAASELAKTNYADMRAVNLPCVPGVKVDYLTYVAVLDEAAQYAKQLEVLFLDPLITYLAGKLNQPDGLRSLAPDPSLQDLTLTTLNQLNKAIAQVTDSHRDMAYQPYGKLIKRNADWAAVVSHAEAIHQAFVETDHLAFQRKVQRVDELLGLLIQRVTHDHELYKVSGKALTLLAEKAYFTATAVEFYGLTYRRASVLDYQLGQLVEAVRKL